MSIEETARQFGNSTSAVPSTFAADGCQHVAVVKAMNNHQVQQLIHGHIHRAAIHCFELAPERPAKRIVLGDWYDAQKIQQQTRTSVFIWHKKRARRLFFYDSTLPSHRHQDIKRGPKPLVQRIAVATIKMTIKIRPAVTTELAYRKPRSSGICMRTGMPAYKRYTE